MPSRYHFLYSGGIGYDEIENARDNLPFTRIELERTECFGACPSYVMTFNANGTAEYNGREHAARTGAFEGEVEIWDYGQICWMIDRFRVLNGPRDYAANWTGAPTAVVRITSCESSDVVEIRDYGGQGPVELWSIFNAMDGVSSRIDWVPEAK